MVRVRQIIENLSYDDLVGEGIIPDIIKLIETSESSKAVKRYPPFVYKTKDFAFFGVIMDYIIRAGLRINLNQQIEMGCDAITEEIKDTNQKKAWEKYATSKNLNEIVESILKLLNDVYGTESYKYDDIKNYIPTLINIIKDIVKKWEYFKYYLEGVVKFNAQFQYKNIEGHPDVVCDNCVLDIKNTGSFSKMAKQSSLQILAYYALMKNFNPSIKYIGFILPMQRDIIIYNIESWNSEPFLQYLYDKSTRNLGEDSETLMANLINNIFGQFLSQNSQTHSLSVEKLSKNKLREDFLIGHHISKEKNIATTLNNFINNFPKYPCQMFLCNPRTGRRDSKTLTTLPLAKKLITDHQLIYFTHTPFVINLCSNQCDTNGVYWQQRLLNEDLDFTKSIGGRGVVVHTGARKTQPEHQALDVMEYMVKQALPHATEECPLLLETPCREGTEVCGYIESFMSFFYRFTTSELRLLGVCIDTAHVFGAGYNPLEYLQLWESNSPVKIKLVHFNDSAVPCGSCKDRHAFPGSGHIGFDTMSSIAQWCFHRQIPMIIE